MASPIFRFYQSASLSGPWTAVAAADTSGAVTPNNYVKVQLSSTAGVDSIAVSLPTADPTTIAATIPVVTTDQASKTATFRWPDAFGRTINVQVTINQGIGANGADPTLTRSLQAYSLTEAGLVVTAVGEADEYDRTYGWTPKINELINAAQPPTFRVIKGSVVTTSGTPAKVICSVPALTSNGVVLLIAYIQGRDTAANAASYFTYAAYKCVASTGAWTLVGTAGTPMNLEDVGGWGAAFGINGTTHSIDLTVTGDATNNTTFGAQLEVRTLLV